MSLTQFDETYPSWNQSPISVGYGLSPANFLGGDDRIQRLDSLIFTSDDTIDHHVQIWADFNAAPVTLIGTVLVPALSGTDGVLPAVEAVPLLFPLLGCWLADRQYGLSIIMVEAVTSGKFVYLTAAGGYL